MPDQWIMLREVADGQANLIGVTEPTDLTPRQMADNWVLTRTEIVETVRLHFAKVTAVTTVDANPDIVRRATTAVIPPEEAFRPEDTPIIDMPDFPPPEPTP